jgi:hypothetical protein
MPQFWIAIFFILLGIAELYQSVQSIVLPFPAYLVLGTLLAVASNYQYRGAVGQIRQVPLQEIEVADPVLSSSACPILPTTEPLPVPAENTAIEIAETTPTGRSE